LLILAGGALACGCGGGSGGNGSAQVVQVGVDWARVADGGGKLFASPGEDVYVTDICSGGPGLVAVGCEEAEGAAGPWGHLDLAGTVTSRY
jgi:hypothetical protein